VTSDVSWIPHGSDPEADMRSIVEHLPAVLYIDSDETLPKTLYISPNVEVILGYPQAFFEDAGPAWVRLIHPDDLAGVLEAWKVAFDQGVPFDREFRHVRPDGTEVWVHDHSVLIRDAEGNRLHWRGVLLNITDRVQAERELATSEARYRALVEGIPAVVYEMGLDDQRRTLYASPHIEALFGYTRDEWLDQQDIWEELLHPDDREIELAAHDLHSATGDPWSREYRLIAADGRVVWVRDQAVLLRAVEGRPLTWQGVMVDITAQKEAEEGLRTSNDDLEFRVLARTAQLEEANELMTLEIGERRRVERELRSAEERFRHLVEDLPAVVYRRQVAQPDDDRDHAYASPQIEELLGFTPIEWQDERIRMSRLHPHDHARVTEAWERSCRTGEPFEMQYRYFDKSGRIVQVLDRATMLARNAAGEPFLFQGVLIDLTARLDAERKAAEAEERFRELAELGPMVPYSFEVDHGDQLRIELRYMGPLMSEILGLPREAWIEPARWFELMHPDDRDQVVAQTRANAERGEPWDVDYRMIAADGRIVWLNDRGRCVECDEIGRPIRFQGVMLDVSTRRTAEDALAAEHAILRDLVEGMPAVPWTHTVDADSGRARYVFMGVQAYELVGYTSEELIAEPYHFPRLVHPDDRQRVTRASEASDRTGVWDDEYRVVHRDGSIRWIHGVGRRVTPTGWEPATWHGVTFDVTSRHAPEEPVGAPIEDQAGQQG
jgi:PAS domain S-box-containing protein